MPPVTPLVRPDIYFAECDPPERHVYGVLGVVLVGWPLLIVHGIGVIFAVHLAGPARPLNVLVRFTPDDLLLPLVEGALFLWFSIGVLLHVGSWMAGSDRGFGPSFVVAAWGMVPYVLGSIVGLIALFIAFEATTAATETVPAGLDAAATRLRAFRPISTVLTVVTPGWGTVIWRYGLEYERGLTGRMAWAVAGLVATLVTVGALL